MGFGERGGGVAPVTGEGVSSKTYWLVMREYLSHLHICLFICLFVCLFVCFGVVERPRTVIHSSHRVSPCMLDGLEPSRMNPAAAQTSVYTHM